MSDSGFREEKKTEREFSTCGPKTSAQINSSVERVITIILGGLNQVG